MKTPNWVNDPRLSEDEVHHNQMRFSLRVASAFHNREAALSQLSVAAGYSPNYLQTALSINRLPERARLAICAVVGFDVFKLEPNDNF